MFLLRYLAVQMCHLLKYYILLSALAPGVDAGQRALIQRLFLRQLLCLLYKPITLTHDKVIPLRVYGGLDPGRALLSYTISLEA